ncbi:MAG: hypothetical protein ABI880_00590 [Acidobacteriota bacterium]
MPMRTFIVAGFVMALGAAWSADAQSPQAQADLARTKLQTVMGSRPTAAPPRRTVFSQTEMNAYLKYRAEWLPVGLTEPTVQFVGPNRIATLVTADLDGVRKKSSGGWFDPTSYLSGRLPVYVTGTLTTEKGQGRFVLETATVDGIPVPRAFIHELMAYYTRSTANPGGVRMEEPFDLPSAIDRIDVTAGQAIVIQ